MHVKPGRSLAQAKHAEAYVSHFAATGEDIIVEFVDVPLVVEDFIQGLRTGFDGLEVTLICVTIGPPRHAPPDDARCDRQEHQAVFGAAGVLFFLLSRSHLAGLAFFAEDGRFPREDRFEEFSKAIAAAQAMRPSEPARENRAERQNHQRDRHGLRRFVDVMLDFVAHAGTAMECQVHEAEHVEGCH